MATTHALTIEPDQKQLLEELAASQFRSPEMLVREAIAQYLSASAPAGEELMGKEAYAQFLADGQASWEDFQRTGLHLTNEEVASWIDRLRDDPGAQLPECHT